MPAGYVLESSGIKQQLQPELPAMRLLLLVLSLLFLASCEEAQLVKFAQPYPASAPVVREFPKQHRGWYAMPTDSTHRLLITPSIIWSESMWTLRATGHALDSLAPSVAGKTPGVWYSTKGGSMRLRPGRADTTWLDTWTRDTLCSLTPEFKGQVRWYRGAYYVSQPAADEQWKVERLAFDGRQLSWQRLGNDTMRIAVLPAGVVRRVGAKDEQRWLLNPRTRQEEQQIARYAGLWAPWREMLRQ